MFMIEMIVDMWKDNALGKCLSIMFIFLIMLLVSLVGFLMFTAADSAFLTYQKCEAKVVSTKFEPAHSTTVMQTTMVGSITTMTPITTYYPDSYYATLTMEEINGQANISKEIYNKLEKG